MKHVTRAAFLRLTPELFKVALTGIIIVFATASIADVIIPTSYREAMSLVGGTDHNVGSTPHASPVVYSAITNNPGVNTSVAEVAFSSSPVPSVSASVWGSSYDPMYGHVSSAASAILSYDIGVNGAASSYVPVDFSGLYSIYYEVGAPGNNYVQLMINNDMKFSIGCERYTCTTTYPRGISILPTDEGWGFKEGHFLGSENIKLDTQGHALISVYMYVKSSFLSRPGQNRATAFLDPYFEIDPEWIANNPDSDASLTFVSGVGNTRSVPLSNSVPEPETYTLFLAALGLLGVISKRRKIQ